MRAIPVKNSFILATTLFALDQACCFGDVAAADTSPSIPLSSPLYAPPWGTTGDASIRTCSRQDPDTTIESAPGKALATELPVLAEAAQPQPLCYIQPAAILADIKNGTAPLILDTALPLPTPAITSPIR